MAAQNRRSFRSFNRGSGGFTGAPAAANVPQRPAAVAIVPEFPGATIEGVEVCVFGGEASLDNGQAECHLSITGNMNTAPFTIDLGRYNPAKNTPRITLESVWAWAKKYGLVHSHNGPESASQSTGEKYIMVYLVAKAEKVGGFAA